MVPGVHFIVVFIGLFIEEDIKRLRGSRLKTHLDVIVIGILHITQLETEKC